MRMYNSYINKYKTTRKKKINKSYIYGLIFVVIIVVLLIFQLPNQKNDVKNELNYKRKEVKKKKNNLNSFWNSLTVKIFGEQYAIQKDVNTLIRSLWNKKNFDQIIIYMDKYIQKNPKDDIFFLYRGFSYYLKAEAEAGEEKQKIFLDQAVKDLRRAMAIGVNKKQLPSLYYVLGKAYYYKGEYYYNVALNYLTKSLDAGYKKASLYYTLGACYSHIGEYALALQAFKSAEKLNSTDILLLTISQTYLRLKQFKNCLVYLNKTITGSENPRVLEKAWLLSGETYFQQGELELAMDAFDNVLKVNINNANAYFFKGEIYNSYNDLVAARFQWRKVLSIDPNHRGARNRLY